MAEVSFTLTISEENGGGDEPTQVDLENGFNDDAGGDNFEYNAALGETDIIAATIANFGADDSINVDDVYDDPANMLFATTGDDEVNFAFGDLTEFTPTFTISMTNLDADLVADVAAADDSTAALGSLGCGLDYVSSLFCV